MPLASQTIMHIVEIYIAIAKTQNIMALIFECICVVVGDVMVLLGAVALMARHHIGRSQWSHECVCSAQGAHFCL
jgi:hypothetical protein